MVYSLKYHCYCIGVTQSGKTTTATKLLYSQNNTIQIFFNTKNEKKWHKHCKYIVYSQHAIEFLEQVYKNPEKYRDGIICINPDINEGKKSIVPICQFIINQHIANQKLKTTFLIDEIHVFQTTHGLDKWIERIFVMGLGLGIKCIAIAQRPQQIHNTIRNNAETIILHYTTNADLQYLKDQGLIDKEFKFKSKHSAFIRENAMKGWTVLQ